ncbi:MAG: hypothetical protein WCD42_05420 [Rhizomicrobium sp.]
MPPASTYRSTIAQITMGDILDGIGFIALLVAAWLLTDMIGALRT